MVINSSNSQTNGQFIWLGIFAHPDDETSRMLAKLSLQDGMHVVYVNAVRGQGGPGPGAPAAANFPAGEEQESSRRG